jgi:hypothetical protein
MDPGDRNWPAVQSFDGSRICTVGECVDRQCRTLEGGGSHLVDSMEVLGLLDVLLY